MHKNKISILNICDIKTLIKLGIEVNFLNITKRFFRFFRKLTSNLTLTYERLEHLIKSANKARMSTLTITNQYCFESPSQCIMTRKIYNSHMGWTAINKTSLFTDVLILYIENTKESPKKVLEHKF